ncbi:MAG: hypothetical protein AAGD35_23135 [Actinomycetota bacterium]
MSERAASQAQRQGGSNVSVTRIDGVSPWGNRAGIELKIRDYTKVEFDVPDLRRSQIDCDFINADAGFSEQRQQCLNGKKFTCASLYGTTSRDVPDFRYSDLVPSKPVAAHVADKAAVVPKDTEVVGINLGFFDTARFGNRPNGFVSMIEEPCVANLGTLNSNAPGTPAVSSYFDREKGADLGNPFGTMIIQQNGDIDITTRANFDDFVGNRDLAFSGVWIRRNSGDIAKTARSVPDFVEEKWGSSVGRTAIALNTRTKAMAILVVQPGTVKGFTRFGKGATVDDLQSWYDRKTYPDLLLLDGSGSSQWASNFGISYNKKPAEGFFSMPVRTNCYYMFVINCSYRTMAVPKDKVDHYSPRRTLPQVNTGGQKMLTDRNVGSALLISDRNISVNTTSPGYYGCCSDLGVEGDVGDGHRWWEVVPAKSRQECAKGSRVPSCTNGNGNGNGNNGGKAKCDVKKRPAWAKLAARSGKEFDLQSRTAKQATIFYGSDGCYKRIVLKLSWDKGSKTFAWRGKCAPSADGWKGVKRIKGASCFKGDKF